jgi:hypothetical protein
VASSNHDFISFNAREKHAFGKSSRTLIAFVSAPPTKRKLFYKNRDQQLRRTPGFDFFSPQQKYPGTRNKSCLQRLVI